ncbi:hypothetical protein K470DRAFT_71657 [Piedraia hortae CBS 480.64]|uniref:Uncharacterized protein n=1 Tax=Piedraia hortae CBS 480.64 TaxID=1314780 RepID=A0A6A7BZF7_9PEZI|nr:hypothetical protein K470DRAFT_71657 [Piedraia hortae CBS 480.64]
MKSFRTIEASPFFCFCHGPSHSAHSVGQNEYPAVLLQHIRLDGSDGVNMDLIERCRWNWAWLSGNDSLSLAQMLRRDCVCAGPPASPKRRGNLLHRRALLVIHSYARYHARMHGASGLVYSILASQ